MRATASVFVATSLDGYIARPDGSIDWLDEANTVVPESEDCGYGEFIRSVDVLVMGRNTFEAALAFDDWPYEGTRVVVLSSRPLTIPASLPTVSASSEAPEALVNRLSAEGAHRLYVDGGITIQRFLAAGLIDDITITLIPVLIGDGRPLFGALAKDVKLAHVATRTFDFGFVQVKYRVVRSRPARDTHSDSWPQKGDRTANRGRDEWTGWGHGGNQEACSGLERGVEQQ